MNQPIIVEIGKPHYLYTDGSQGACCGYLDSLNIAIFWRQPSEVELHPREVTLALQVYQRSILFVLRMDSNYVDMPYYGVHDDWPEFFPEGWGLITSLAICDTEGICRSLAGYGLSNVFSNALSGAVAEQKRTGFTEAEHEHAIASAYTRWPTPKAMFDSATIKETGWSNI